MRGASWYPQRKQMRLRTWDYAEAGAYYFTAVTIGGRPLFGDVVDGEMRLNAHGETVARCWYDLPQHYRQTALDKFIVMPNHVHGVIWLHRAERRPGLKQAPCLRQ